ncbi:MAG: phospholipase, partial [Actinomycetota bacterium]|nr:phospholipase [Actinomycetota bacterium]
MAARSPLHRLDAAIGSALEYSVRAHHRRRLSRRGHARAFDPPPGGWAETGTFAPRAGSQVE